MTTILDRFLRALEDWPSKLQYDEWYFAKLREQITKEITPDQAFKEIYCILELASKQIDEFIVIEALELALSLMRKADTTEKPDGIEELLNRINDKLSKFVACQDYIGKQIKDIQKWFRIQEI